MSSTTKLCLSWAESDCATIRAVSSVGPPAGYGTMIVTLRLGYCCATAVASIAAKLSAADTIKRFFRPGPRRILSIAYERAAIRSRREARISHLGDEYSARRAAVCPN